MSKDYTCHVIEELEKVHTFYIDFDLSDDGSLKQMKQDFYDELFEDITDFAFGPRVSKQKLESTNPVRLLREAVRKIYKIPEIEAARKYYLENESVEDKYLKRGEFGELVLYHLLNEYFGAEALISKIYFKDSAGLPAHGFDAVHVNAKENVLWLGESKLYEDGYRAIDALVQDLDEHFKRDFFDDEFVIISNRASDEHVELDEYLKQLIDPRTKTLDKLASIKVALFAGYTSNVVANGDGNEEFKKNLEIEIQKLRNKANKKSKGHPWVKNGNLDVYLFLFPLASKKEFVRDMHNKLKGVQIV